MSVLSAKFTSFWELEEASGTRVDSVGASANDLTDNNTVTQAAGKVGNAGQFTAVNSEYLSRADNASLSVGNIDWTLCGWVYLDDKTNLGGGLHSIVTKDDASVEREYHLIWLVTSDRFRFTAFGSASGGDRTDLVASTFGAPSLSTWYFIVAWHDSVANTINIQINNGTVDSAAHTAGIYDGAANFNIGELATDGAGSRSWSGRIDQVGVAKAIFTADERTYLYNSGNGRSWAEIVAMDGAVFSNSRFVRQAVQRAAIW